MKVTSLAEDLEIYGVVREDTPVMSREELEEELAQAEEDEDEERATYLMGLLASA